MKKLFFIAAYLVALSASPVIAQTSAPVVAVVSIKYAGDGAGLGHLLINREGKIEKKDVLNAAFGNPISADQVMIARANVLRQIVTQLYQEGYILEASLAHDEVDELVFIKEK